MKYFKADMHIHTCLSPCAEWEMSPKSIVEKSREKGLDIIAVCDHNTAENVAAVMKAGQRIGITVLPGMEICSKEEVHILAIMNNPDNALAMQEYVYNHLSGINKPDLFGYQIVANEDNEVLAENERLLIGATTLGIYEIVEKTHQLGGLSIASHVDRPSFSIISQLGFIPPDIEFDAVEVSHRMSPLAARNKIPGIRDLPCITSSDAHFPDDIGKVNTFFLMEIPTIDEIRLALKQAGGRKII